MTTTDSVGDSRVDAALGMIADLAERPVAEHLSVLDQAHTLLREALANPVSEGGLDAGLRTDAPGRAGPVPVRPVVAD